MKKAIDYLKAADNDLSRLVRDYDDQFRKEVTVSDIDGVIARLVQAKLEMEKPFKEHDSNPDCWCEPELDGGVWVHKDLH